MTLNKRRVGDLITVIDEKNTDGVNYPFFGVNINKEFMPSVANTSHVDNTKYKIIKKNRFVFSGMQTGRDNCIRISIYTNDDCVLVSPAYTTFEVTSPDILPLYFFMVFNSKEMDRFGAFLSDSSVRANLDWDRFCDIEITVPDKSIQEKYVNIYEGLISNRSAYEKRLDDLKIACDGFIENLRKRMTPVEIGSYIQEENERNNGLSVLNVQGVNSGSTFGETKANTMGLDFHNYKIVKNGYFAYNPSRINLGSIALRKGEDCIVSPMYCVFSVKNSDELLPEYLMLWLTRKEFFRSTLFYAIGSVRDSFDFSSMKEVKIPIPSIDVQKSIVQIYECYNNRRILNEKINKQISDICPILIRGSIMEAKGGN